jgi:DNA polymerase-4
MNVTSFGREVQSRAGERDVDVSAVMQRFVLHADFDAFFVSVERACNPSLRGRPVAVGGSPQTRGIIIAASPEAQAYGVRPAMPVASARKLCSDLVIVQGNDHLYRRASYAVVDHLQRYTPRYETASVDEAYLDLTGVQRLFGRAVDVGARLRKEIIDKFRLEMAVGVASNKLVSKVASDVAGTGGLCDVRAGDEAGFLGPLPVGRLPGVGWSVEHRLWDFNIETIRELAETDHVFLDNVFGRRGRVLHAHAQGLDDTPVGRTRKPKFIGHDVTLDRNCNDRQVIQAELFGCVEFAAAQLRVLGLITRNLAVRIQFVDGIRTTRTAALTHPTDIDSEIFASSDKLLTLCLSRRSAVRQIGIRCSRLAPYNPQLRLFSDRNGYDRHRSLMAAIDRIRHDHGAVSLTWGRMHVASRPDERPSGNDRRLAA